MTVPFMDNNGRHFDQNGKDITEYVRIVVATEYDTTGRITGSRSEGRAYLMNRINNGERIYLGDGGYDFVKAASPNYIDLSSTIPTLKKRPIIDWSFDKVEVSTGQEAKIVKIPPCSINFSGPLVGSQPHTAFGDVTIGFTTPGVYDIIFEAFPYMPAVFKLTVKQGSGVTVAGKAIVT